MSESSEDEYTKFEIESVTSETSRVEYNLRDFSEVVGNHPPDEDRKRSKTAALFGGFFSLGLVIGILGPTIPDLLYQVNASYDQLSYIFLSRGFGYMTGSIISGFSFERFNAFGLLGTFLVACTFGMLCVPATRRLVTIVVTFIVSGTAMGGLDTGGNVLCLRIWGEQSPPYMQALHFTFAIGACAAPLIARPFISVFAETLDGGNISTSTDMMSTIILEITQWRAVDDLQEEINSATFVPLNVTYSKIKSCPENITCNTVNNTKLNTTPYTTEEVYKIITTDVKLLTHSDHRNTPTNRGSGPRVDDVEFEEIEILGNMFKVYGIIAIITFLTSLAFYYFCLTSPYSCNLKCSKFAKHAPLADDERSGQKDKWFRIQMLSILFVFYFLYIGGEVAFGSYIYSYAINCDLKLSKDSASLLNSLFWGTFAVFRGFAIFLAYVFTPLQMLMSDVIICIGAAIVLVLFANTSQIGLWSGTAVLGAAMASLFPTGLSWLERYIQVTGNDAAILVVGASFGEMIIPFVIGQYFPDDDIGDGNGNENIDALMYLVLIIACLTFVLFLIAYKLAARKGDRYSLKTEVGQSAPREIPMTSL